MNRSILLAALVLATACMTGPHDGQVWNGTSNLSLNGYLERPNEEVRLVALSSDGVWRQLQTVRPSPSLAIRSAATATRWDEANWYGWSATVAHSALTPYWRNEGTTGRRIHLKAQTRRTSTAAWTDLYSFRESILSTSSQCSVHTNGRTVSDLQRCLSTVSPIARLQDSAFRGCGTSDTSCNGRDEDCDGRIDENYAPPTVSPFCGRGACFRYGTERCSSGARVVECTPGTPTGDDTNCDGVDDDCDGRTDEHFVVTQVSCGSGVGVCAQPGTRRCVSGAITTTCEPGGTASDETCNGVDDDCDGATDESHSACAEDQCVAATACGEGGVPQCRPKKRDDTCDGIDDDCDGEIDEHTGTTDATCDGVDDDCDGRFDENFVDLNPCSVDTCSSGVLTSTPIVSGACPRDPSLDAPDQGTTSSFSEEVGFLLDGYQASAERSVLVPERMSRLFGVVRATNGHAMGGVGVSVLGHPEFGRVITRADGRWDLIVNGGGRLTVKFERTGFPEAQRDVRTDWNRHHDVDDVVMVPYDARATQITGLRDGTTEIQVHRATRIDDGEGARTATILIPTGTSGTMTLPDGTTEPLPSSVTLRATEYTVGRLGPAAMPGRMPEHIAYTYAVELSLDEAVARNASQVTFDQPVYFYLENFLGFEVGGGAAGTVNPVPIGWYDRVRGVWVPSQDGAVIRLLGVDSDGRVRVDADGDSFDDSPELLAALGFTEEELGRLAALYPEPTTVWRAPIPHFTPWDCNWPFDLADDATYPPDEGAETPPMDGCGGTLKGTIIGCDNRTVAEEMPIAGTGVNLRYQSDRVPASVDHRRIRVLLTRDPRGGTPRTRHSTSVVVRIAGRTLTAGSSQSVESPPGSGRRHVDILWDGLDWSGQAVVVPQTAEVQICHHYVVQPMVLGPRNLDALAAQSALFGRNGAGRSLAGSREEMQASLCTTYETTRTYGNGALDTREVYGLGGLALDVVHRRDLRDGIILGNGQRSSSMVASRLWTLAGSPGGDELWTYQDRTGEDPRTIDLGNVTAVATSPDGRIFFAAGHQSNETSPLSIYSIERSGLLRKIAGSSRLAGTNCSEDDVPAIGAMIGRPTRMLVDDLGNLYLNGCANVLRRITPDGVLQRVAGTGVAPPAASTMSFPSDAATGEGRDRLDVPIAVDDIAIWNRTIVFLDRTVGRVRQIEPGGTVRTILGGGSDASAPSLVDVETGGAASWRLHPAATRGIQSIEVIGARLWFVARSQLFELTAGGEVRAISGAAWDTTSEEIPEDTTLERFPRRFDGIAGGDYVTTIAADPLGERVIVSVASSFGRTWLWLVEGGRMHRLDGDGTPPARPLEGARSDAFLLDGTQGAIHWGSGGRLLRVNRRGSVAHIEQSLLWQTAGRLALPGGDLEVEFDARGRHVATFDARTGVEQLRIVYDSDGRFPVRLLSDGQTLLEVVRSGRAARLIRPEPYGTETLVRWNEDGWVTEVSYPEAPSAGVTAFSYSSDAEKARRGMVRRIMDREGLGHELDFDDFGVLRSDVLVSAEGTELRRWDLEAVDGTVTVDGLECASREVLITAEENTDRVRSYERVVCDDFERRRTETPDGSFSQVERRGRVSTTTDSTGVVVTQSTEPHPILGGDFVAQTTIRMPSGRSAVDRTTVEASADPATGALETERVSTTSTSGTVSTLFQRTDDGSEVVTTSAAGRRTLTRFDAQGRVVWSAVTDVAGQPLFHPHQIEYDSLGRVRALFHGPEDREPSVLRQTSVGYIQSSIDRGWSRSVTTTTGADTAAEVTFDRDPLGRVDRVTVDTQVTGFGFDSMGRVNRVTPPERATHESSYSHDGELRSYTPPPATDPGTGASVSSLQSWEPGAHRGEVARYSVTDGTITRESVPEYDASGRVESVAITGIPGDVSFSYAPRAGETVGDTGQLRHATMPQTRVGLAPVATTLFYDGPLGTETRTEGLPNAPWKVGYHHDAADDLRLAHLTVAVGSATTNVPTIAYDYDADGLITALGYGYDADGVRLHEGSYDENVAPNPTIVRNMAVVPDPQTGVLLRTCVGGTVAFGSGTCSGRVNTDVTPNDFGEPASVETTWNGSAVAGSLSFHYEHDRAGRIVARTEVEGASSTRLEYGYDAQGRLENVWRRTSPTTRERIYHYGYDANGNRIGWDLPTGSCDGSTCALVDEQDRLLRADGVTYRYDLQGQLATRTEGTRAETFTYDMASNLRTFVVREGGTQTRHVQYAIDAFGRRVGRYVGTSGATSADRFWVYQDGLNPVAQLNASGQLELLFLYGTRAHVPDLVVEVRGASTTDDVVYRVVTDQVGSVRRLVNVETGAVAASFDYSPFGVLEREDGALAARFPFRFAGGLWDGDTGLVRFGARDYDPRVGRWTAKDPILWGGGQGNLYEYAGGDSINLIDPSGLVVRVRTRPLDVQVGLGSLVGAAGAHSWIEVEHDGVTTTFSGIEANGRLEVVENLAADLNVARPTSSTIVPPPGDMTQTEWDQAVLRAGREAIGRSKSVAYTLFPDEGHAGNCHSVTTWIIGRAGGSIAGLDPPGLNPGLGAHDWNW